jgi:protein SCO1/2
MVHTENFVLVDTKKRVRGFYDGTNKEDIKRLIEDITFFKYKLKLEMTFNGLQLI